MSETHSMNLLDLTDEILVKILENLSLAYVKAVRQTCSRLQKLTYTAEIMKKQKFVLPSFKPDTMKEMLNIIAEKETNVLNLEVNLSRCDANPELIHNFIESLHLFGAKINSLVIGACQSSSSFVLPFIVLEYVLLFCVNLKELDFRGIEIQPCSKTSLIKPEDVNKTLETLSVLESLNFSDRTINVLLNFYPAIKNLFLRLPNFSFKKTVTNQFYKNNIYEEPTNAALTADFLIHKINSYNIHIENLILDLKGTGFTKQQFKNLIHSDLKLHSICLTNQRFLPKKYYLELFSTHNLKEFEIVEGKYFDYDCLQFLLIQCPDLRRLCIKEIPKFDFAVALNIINHIAKKLKILCFKVDDFMNPNRKRIVQSPRSYLDISNSSSITNSLRPFTTLERIELNLETYHRLGFNFLTTFSNVTHFELGDVILPEAEILLAIYPLQATLTTLILFAYSPVSQLISPKRYDLHFPKLKKLYLTVSTSLACEILHDYNFPSLVKLRLNDRFIVETTDYEKIMSGCPLLEEFEFRVSSPQIKQTILDMPRNWPFLRKFYCSVV